MASSSTIDTTSGTATAGVNLPGVKALNATDYYPGQATDYYPTDPVAPAKPVTQPAVISTTQGQQMVQKDQKTLSTLAGTPVAPVSPTSSQVDTTSPSIRVNIQTGQPDPNGVLVDNPNYRRNVNPLPQPNQNNPSGATQPASLTLINPTTGQTQTLTGNSITADQVQTLQSQGYQVSERVGDIPSSVFSSTQAQTQANADLASAAKDFNDLKAGLSQFTVSDAALQSQIQGITQQWDARIADMQRINDARKQSIFTTGIRTGSQYSGGLGGAFGGIIAEEERQGVQRIGDLEGAKQSAIAAAQEAARTQNWKVYAEQVSYAEKAYTEKLAAVKELNKTVAENNKKIQEQLRSATVDSAISSLIQQGVTDPAQIIDALNYDNNGNLIGDVSMKEITDTIKSMQAIEKDQPGIVGEWVAALKTGAIPEGTTLEGYMDIKEPGRALDFQQKQLQIAKLQKELNSSGDPKLMGEDPSNILAYAQQYASTGAIPTGLPKGTFGIVAQMGKELPKSTGTIVNSTTGVADSKSPAVEQADFARLYNILNNVNRLAQLNTKRSDWFKNGVLDVNAQGQYLATAKAIVDDMQRMQSGAALTPDETAFYADYIPGRFAGSFGGQDPASRIQNFKDIITNRLNERLSSNGLAMYGYSKVNIGGKDYTVGDVVTNDAGESGRVLPDGSIALIQ